MTQAEKIAAAKRAAAREAVIQAAHDEFTGLTAARQHILRAGYEHADHEALEVLQAGRSTNNHLADA